MITLNTERGYEKVATWEEINSLPGFMNDLDPSEHKLETIIGRYEFKEKIRCGLSNCHTPHSKGYIVKTIRGTTTNIGKDCGKNIFGVDFESLSRQFDRDVTDAENRARLWGFSFQMEELEQSLNALLNREFGAKWVNHNIHALTKLAAGCPEEVVRKIKEMVKARSNTLTVQRAATESEMGTSEAMTGQRVRHVDEQIAIINGMQALYPENDLRELLVVQIESQLREFKKLDIDLLGASELRRWLKWADSVEGTMETASAVAEQGKAFLSKANLAPFTHLLSNRDDNKQFRSYLKGLHE